MKLCPMCKSDSIEKNYSIGLRVAVCIILLFIPFGFLFCWIPFILPRSYICNICGTDIKEDELIDIDWREKELILEQYKKFEEKIDPFLNRWFIDEKIYKVIKAKGQFLLLEFTKENVYSYRIIDCNEENSIRIFTVSKKLSSDFNILKSKEIGTYSDKEVEKLEDTVSPFGKQVLSEEEIKKFEDGNTCLIDWLKNNGKLMENIKIVKSES